MRSKIFLITIFINASLLFSQEKVSLQTIIKNTNDDTLKYSSMLKLGELYIYQNSDSSKLLLTTVKLISEKKLAKNKSDLLQKKYSYFLAHSIYGLGVLDMYVNKLDDAKKKFQQAEKFYSLIGNKEGIGNCLNNIGYIYYNKGDISRTLSYYQKAIKIYLQIDYFDGLIASYINLAPIYSDQQEFKFAVENYQKALFLSKKIKNDSYIAICSVNLALVYLNYARDLCDKNSTEDCTQDYENRSLTLFNESYRLNLKIGDEVTNAAVLNNLGLLYSRRKAYQKAEEYYYRAQELAIKTKSKRTLAYVKVNLAELLLNKNQVRKARICAEESLSLAKETTYFEIVKNAAKVLKKIYQQEGNFKGALEMTTLFHQLKDSISNELTKKSNIKRQLEITYEKKSFADSLRSEKQKALVQLRLEKKENQQKYLLIIVVITFISIIIIYKRLRVNNKQKKIIEQKNLELERYNLLNQKIFSVISHDFKGPITTLKSLLTRSELLTIENPLVNLYIKDINTQMEQSDQMLESLLDWAKAELSLSFSERETFILPVINTILGQLNVQLKAKNLKVIHQIDEKASLNLPHEVLKIVMRNLLSNAIKYSFEGNIIEIEAGINIIKVIDYGKGIEPNKLELLFNEQVASGLGTSHETGFGLGLYMCNELLLKNNAKLKAKINKNQAGCTFIIEKT
jgi:two-component system, sensor histidine kinase and response regulator